MNTNVVYHNNQGMYVRFLDHAKLGLSDQLGKGRPAKNGMEKAGDAILDVVSFPRRAFKIICQKLQDPRVLTIVLTSLALVAATFIFYPVSTAHAVATAARFAIKLIAKIPFAYYKFAAYIATCSTILGFGIRAEGRFSNTELMNQFYDTSKIQRQTDRLNPPELLICKV